MRSTQSTTRKLSHWLRRMDGHLTSATCWAALCMAICGGCDSIDCSLQNTVACRATFYNDRNQQVALTDTLDVLRTATDSVLYNKGIKPSEVHIPLSYYHDRDTLTLRVYGKDYEIRDTLVMEKKNIEHFESLDCPVKMFHTLTSIHSTRHFIDSVKIINPTVNYTNGENIKIYLRPAQ